MTIENKPSLKMIYDFFMRCKYVKAYIALNEVSITGDWDKFRKRMEE